MIGTIELERIHVDCIVGIHPHERVREQSIELDVAMDLDFAEAAGTELVEATIDYTEVARILTELVVGRKYQLVETMAEEAASLVLTTWPRVRRVEIVVHKPAAVPQARDTRVRVIRTP